MPRFFSVFLVGLLACEQGSKPAPTPPAAPASQPASRPIARKPPPLVLPNGIDPIRDLQEQNEAMRAHKLVSGTALSAFLPKAYPAGFRCNPAENTQGGVQGMVMTQSALPCLQAKAGEKDERSLIITIADYNAHPRMLSTYEALARGKATKDARPVKVAKKYPGQIGVDAQTKIGKGSVVVNKRYPVTVQLADGTFDEVTRILSSVDLDGLSALVASDANQVQLDDAGELVDPKNGPKKNEPNKAPKNAPEKP